MIGRSENSEGSLNRFVLTGFMIIFIIVIFLVCNRGAYAEDQTDVKCLIIVSGYGGYPATELSKAASLYNHLNYDDEDIMYLTDPSSPGSDGPANISDVEDAFDWLKTNSISSDEVTVYISDHEKRVLNDVFFVFDDGNISISVIESWLDQVSCSKMTIILNGERSGLGGPDLYESGREVICSMGSDQEFDPDLFNITRSLEDPSADTNQDGKVTYVEAYWKEVDNLQGTGQDPCIWY